MARRPKLPDQSSRSRATARTPGRTRTSRATAPVSLKEQVKEQSIEAGTGIVGWVDERTGASGFLRGFLFRKVPKGTNWFYTLGSATMFAFVAQAVTGVFLAMYYTPSPTEAYDSVQHITNEVFLGELVRGMHRWGATVMVVLIFLHMGRTFFFGAYKYPRELNWVIGVVLLILTMAMALTGYLLPFDNRSFWATVVAVKRALQVEAQQCADTGFTRHTQKVSVNLVSLILRFWSFLWN